MKLEITQKVHFYKLKLDEKELEGIFTERELLKAIISSIRVNYNITDFQLKKEDYY